MEQLSKSAIKRMAEHNNLELSENGNGVKVTMKTGSYNKVRIKISGWPIIKKTKKTVKGRIEYYTYYQAETHIQDFLDQIEEYRHKLLFCINHGCYDKQLEAEEDIFKYQYGIRILSHGPLEPDLSDQGWHVTQRSKICGGDRSISSVAYRCEVDKWQEIMNYLRVHKSYKQRIHVVIPELFNTYNLSEEEMSRSEYYWKNEEHNKRNKLTVTQSGGTRQTKYEYPTNCVTKPDRSKYRRQQRKLRK